MDTGKDVTKDKIIRDKKQSDAYRRIMERRGRCNDFTFTDMENIKVVISSIDEKHCGYLLYLQCFINYNGQLVRSNDIPMSKDEIQETLNLGKTAFSDFFNAMVDNKIIYEVNRKYYVNENYHFKGKSTNSRVIKSFTFKVKRLYSKKNARDLGFIYKLLPFVHYKTNTICENPSENDVSKIRYLPKKEIAILTNESEKSVYNKLRKLKIGNEYVFAEIRSGKERFYKINPFLFYRKDGEPDATLREIFLIGFARNR